jgi:transcriptional regulator with XRE-family HTH domain
VTASTPHTTDLSLHRQRRELTQQEVADMLGCSVRQLSRYEHGERPDIVMAFAFSTLYGVPADRLFPNALTQARALIPAERAAPVSSPDYPDGPIPGRVLGLDPWTRGIGYAVLDGHHLVKCGIRYPGRVPLSLRLREQGRRILADLLVQYRPVIVALPALDTTRSDYVRQFARSTTALARRQGLTVHIVTREDVEEVLGRERSNKHELALAVGEMFPELRDKVPPPRKIWQPQDIRVSMFCAVGLALAGARNVRCTK